MSGSKATWDLGRLRLHEGQCRLLGDGGVAVIYRICGTNRVHVEFFLFEDGQFKKCATDMGEVRTLLRLLDRYDTTTALIQRRRKARPPIGRRGDKRVGHPVSGEGR